jgi:hypothetical protein
VVVYTGSSTWSNLEELPCPGSPLFSTPGESPSVVPAVFFFSVSPSQKLSLLSTPSPERRCIYLLQLLLCLKYMQFWLHLYFGYTCKIIA